MSDRPNFLLGYGERLTAPIPPPPKRMDKDHPYTYAQALKRLAPRLGKVAEEIQQLPEAACPDDRAVAVVTMHPQYIAKSYFPEGMFKEFGLYSVGSRPRLVKPEKWAKKGAPREVMTTELFVAGRRSDFARLSAAVGGSTLPTTTGMMDIIRLEDVRFPTPQERISSEAADDELYEIVLQGVDAGVLRGFEKFAGELGLNPEFDRRIESGGLCFVPLTAPVEALERVARFSFLRAARPLPRMRDFVSPLRAAVRPAQITCSLPTSQPVDPTLRVAVFDGGIEQDGELSPWANAYNAQGVGDPHDGFLTHGHWVTSALLFGPLKHGAAEQPYAWVDHYRVLDVDSLDDPYELYDVIKRIQAVLETRQYQFVNLSVGPQVPIEDDDVHPWTTVLDPYLSDGSTLAAIAVGNDGREDRQSGNARVQVPADCVNALAVGACDSQNHATWKRADYSCFGPGRSPGLVKPDVLGFGGSHGEPFWVLDRATPGSPIAHHGTSLATPATLRLGLGVRAHFGDRISPLAIRALLINCAASRGHEREEVGWGKAVDSLEELVVCPPGAVRVVYQGDLSPASFLRAPIPLPAEQLDGMVNITATFCYTCATDPQDPGNYTRSGLRIVFRPDKDSFDTPTSANPKTDGFFKRKAFTTDDEARADVHQWETVLHGSKKKQGRKLSGPMFDIHHNAREGGGTTESARPVPYALVVTVESSRTPDLYDRVVRRYATQLEAMQPVIQIGVQT